MSKEDLSPARDRRYAHLAFLDEGEARALLVRTRDNRLRGLDGGFGFARDMQWFNALAAAGTACALLGAVDAIDEVATALAVVHRHGSFSYRPEHDLRFALARLVGLAGASSPAVVRLATRLDSEVRLAVATGLRDGREGPERTLLLALAVDRNVEVRAAARGKLPAELTPSWRGTFTVDPVPSLASALAGSSGGVGHAAAEERAKAIVAEISAAFSEPRSGFTLTPAIEAHCALLPDAVLVDLARQVGAEYGTFSEVSPLLGLAAARAGGVALVLDTAERWFREKRRFVSDYLPKMAKHDRVDASTRSRIAWAAVERALAPATEDDHRSQLLGVAAPLFAAEDLERFGDWFVEHQAGPHGDRVVEAIYFRLQLPLTASLQRWAEAELASGRAFVSRSRQSMTCGLVEKLPRDRLRELALGYAAPTSALSDGQADHARRRWALGVLLGGHDEASMGTKAQLVASMFAIPANRACFLADTKLALHALPHARTALRQGELDFPAALVVARSVRRLYGPSPDDLRFSLTAEERADLEPYLGMDDVRGELTAEETRAYDQARERHVFAVAGVEQADFGIVGSESERGVALAACLADEAGRGNTDAAKRLRNELFRQPTAALVAAVRKLDFVALDDPKLDELFDDVVRAEAMLAEGAVEPSVGSSRARGDADQLRPGAAALPWVPALTLREAKKLLRRLGDYEHADDDRPLEGDLGVRHRAAVAKLAGAALVLHGDASGMRNLSDTIDYGIVDDGAIDDIGALIGAMVALTDPAKTNIDFVLEQSYARVRVFAAKNLRPHEPAGRRCLMKLADDENPYVRDTAKSVLGAGAVPWWVGMFTRDPALRLSDGEAKALAPTLKAVAAAINPDPEAPEGQKRPDARAIARLSKKLPADLACDIGRQQGKAQFAFMQISPWVVAALPREGSEVMVRDLVTRWLERDGFFGSLFGPVLAKCDLDARRRFSDALLELFPSDATSARGLDEILASVLLPEYAERAWQKIVAYDGVDEERLDDLCRAWTKWFAQLAEPPAATMAWAVSEVRKLPTKERSDARAFAQAVVKNGPPGALRPLAFDAVGSESQAQRIWGLKMLLGPCHDSAIDGPRAARVRSFFADASIRRDILADAWLVSACLPLARAALRAGELGFAQARTVAHVVRARVIEKGKREAKAKKGAKAKKAVPGRAVARGEPEHGLSASELRAYRAARAAFVFEGVGWAVSDAKIIGTVGAFAMAHWEAAARAAREGDTHAVDALADALVAMPSEPLLDLVMGLLPMYAETGVPEVLRFGLEQAHERLRRKLDVVLVKRAGEE